MRMASFCLVVGDGLSVGGGLRSPLPAIRQEGAV